MIQLHGKLDGSNYMELIAAAERLYNGGDRNLLIDLSNLSYLSSAGIVALHKVAKLFHGQKQFVEEDGWSAYRAVARDLDSDPQPHVKLTGLSNKVRGVLDMVGFSGFFEIYDSIPQAVASFRPPKVEDDTRPLTYRS